MGQQSMVRLRNWSAQDGREGTRLYLWCPACDDLHAVEVRDPQTRWEWDGNEEAPTINPSIKVEYGTHRTGHDPRTNSICHSFVKQGRWEYQGDCTHTQAGKTVPMEPLPAWVTEED